MWCGCCESEESAARTSAGRVGCVDVRREMRRLERVRVRVCGAEGESEGEVGVTGASEPDAEADEQALEREEEDVSDEMEGLPFTDLTSSGVCCLCGIPWIWSKQPTHTRAFSTIGLSFDAYTAMGVRCGGWVKGRKGEEVSRSAVVCAVHAAQKIEPHLRQCYMRNMGEYGLLVS